MADATLVTPKSWWTSKTIIAGALGILLAVYLFVQANFLPNLPVPPSNIVDTIVGILSGLGIFGRVTADTKIG